MEHSNLDVYMVDESEALIKHNKVESVGMQGHQGLSKKKVNKKIVIISV